jgi:hypothetical protein
MIRGWSVKNTKHPPGQVNDKTLGDYIERKYGMPFGPEHNSTIGESLDRQVKDEGPPPWPFPTGGLSQFDKWFHDQQIDEQHRYICKLAYEAGRKG